MIFYLSRRTLGYSGFRRTDMCYRTLDILDTHYARVRPEGLIPNILFDSMDTIRFLFDA